MICRAVWPFTTLKSSKKLNLFKNLRWLVGIFGGPGIPADLSSLACRGAPRGPDQVGPDALDRSAPAVSPRAAVNDRRSANAGSIRLARVDPDSVHTARQELGGAAAWSATRSTSRSMLRFSRSLPAYESALEVVER